MSAYIVSKTHIDMLVSWMVNHRTSYWNGVNHITATRANAGEIGQILIDENMRSVDHRYNEKNVAEPYRFTFMRAPVSLVQIIKAVHCLDYQSCETDDWESTLACRICQTVIDAACRLLPGYEAAKWGVEEPTHELEIITFP